MREVLLTSGLFALILTVLIIGVVRLAGMAAGRMRGRTETLTAERCLPRRSRLVTSTRPSYKSGSCSNRPQHHGAGRRRLRLSGWRSRGTVPPCCCRRCGARSFAMAGAPMAQRVAAGAAGRRAAAATPYDQAAKEERACQPASRTS
jgi:hypothetical protein